LWSNPPPGFIGLTNFNITSKPYTHFLFQTFQIIVWITSAVSSAKMYVARKMSLEYRWYLLEKVQDQILILRLFSKVSEIFYRQGNKLFTSINRSSRRAVFAKMVFFFPGATFFNSIYRTPTKFPGGLKVKKTAQIIQGDRKWWKIFSKNTSEFQEGQIL